MGAGRSAAKLAPRRHWANGQRYAHAVVRSHPEAASLFNSMEQSQEMLALSGRDLSDHLLAEIRRRQQRFTVRLPVLYSASTQQSEDELDPRRLHQRLRRHPQERMLLDEDAHGLLLAMEEQLSRLTSSVLDVKIPEVGQDPRLVLVGDVHGQLTDVLRILEENGEPSPEVTYLFNGDIVDRGRYAVEIWLLLIAFKIAYPNSVHILRGNHENEQMISRPFKMGGGFSEECLSKYNRSILESFQRIFKLLPLFGVIEDEIFVVHGGLFRNPAVNLSRLRSLPESSWRRNYPNAMSTEQLARGEAWTEDEEIIFDAQWADPHFGPGSRPSNRGRVAVTFGEDVTHRFLDEAKLALCIRSHRVPQNGHGFEFEHGGRLLTLFSASRYGGVLQNRGAVGVIRRAVGEAEVEVVSDFELGGSSSSRPPLRRLRMQIVEHDVSSGLEAPIPRSDTESVGKATACQVRRLVEQQAKAHEHDLDRHALALICADRDILWRRCRVFDPECCGLVRRESLCDLLSEVCGDLHWEQTLSRAAPQLRDEVAYGVFLATPQVRWFHLGPSQVMDVVRAMQKADLPLHSFAALFEVQPDEKVTPRLEKEALRLLLPQLREGQLQQLATALFGEEPTSLGDVLHQLSTFGDPLVLPETWMQPALQRLGQLVEKQYGPPPLHTALLRFFRSTVRKGNDVLRPDEFVQGFQKLGAYHASGDAQVPLLHTGRLYKLFEVVDSNKTGAVSIMELLMAMDKQTARPKLPERTALGGAVPAMILTHKASLLKMCHVLDTLEMGRISVDNFLELLRILSQALGRPLPSAVHEALEQELGSEDLTYADVLGSFEVTANGGPWLWGQH